MNVATKMVILFGLLLLFTSCTENPDWKLAAVTHECSECQFKRVEAETLFCNQNTGFLSAYCFGSAILRNCDAASQEGKQP